MYQYKYLVIVQAVILLLLTTKDYDVLLEYNTDTSRIRSTNLQRDTFSQVSEINSKFSLLVPLTSLYYSGGRNWNLAWLVKVHNNFEFSLHPH